VNVQSAAETSIYDEIIAEAATYTHDPLGYVLWAFPWGEGELAHSDGPRTWQRQVLDRIGEQLRAGGDAGAVIREAVASGHGIGKSALVAWLVKWAFDTRENTRGVVTASTDNQLRTKTWPEVAKWHRLSLTQFMGVLTATALHSPEQATQKTWRIDILPWSENNTEAFAGLHNERNRIIVIFDEASGISDKIWEVTEGALTDENTEIIWPAFGNPTKNTGRFRECFGRFKHRWNTRQVDSRTVEGTNKAQLDQWVQDYGEDSDFVKVRVRGEFPSASSEQFIPSDVVERARRAEGYAVLEDPLIMGVDVARFGDDQSVIQPRRGRNAREFGYWTYRGMDTMQLAARVAEKAQELNAHAVFVDAGGVGGGVVDRLRQLNVRGLIGVEFGGRADRSSLSGSGALGEQYANKRAEMYAALRAALNEGLAIPDDPDLQDQLVGMLYGFNKRDEIVLESKKDMKARGLPSPDWADALALTYAYPVAQLSMQQATGNPMQVQHDYDPYAEM
jgi:hypothetical protein